ncbi:alpha/beta fold hydrolase [Pseudazoarcus pumilus]|uniref:Alpha/beta hydrolase n=1 Tax=Pseudazoarcus pumilus TaxID=2067960 RepID=A0A2I6S3G3_9RHOO|nr:alpha/beta hydrolase [Pseudazoarcus pumilus]AUN93757.1 alpha/beta hydrolase [Pseudazoarcus pumilus]
MNRWLPPLLSALLAAPLAALAATPSYGPNLEGFEYPHEVGTFEFRSQGKDVRMAYMDVAPRGTPNGRTVVALHGKNFCGASWEDSIAALTGAGYRVVAPDQIGFCKSTKPDGYQYSFHQLAANTAALLDELGVEDHVVMGHSMGGMLATRYALLYPQRVERLVMVNPIGLEDWLAKGVPYISVGDWYAGQLKVTREGIKNYQLTTYYNGEWRPEFDRWVDMSAGMFNGPGKETVAWHSALTFDMIVTQPVYHEFHRLQVPTLLIIGEHDNTAIGKHLVSEEQRKALGDYRAMARDVAGRIPDVTLHLYPDLAHSPQVQDPARFHADLIRLLD